MSTFSGICFASLLLSLTAGTMEAPKRANEYLESSTIKKICTETKQSPMEVSTIYYVCKAMCNNRLCNVTCATQGLLKRHLREKHGFSPRHLERYSAPVNYCNPEFK
jgi:hypothetical protein